MAKVKKPRIIPAGKKSITCLVSDGTYKRLDDVATVLGTTLTDVVATLLGGIGDMAGAYLDAKRALVEAGLPITDLDSEVQA